MSTNMLMNGTSPVGMVYNQSAENIAYSSGVSVKDKIDEFITKEVTGTTNQTGDILIYNNNEKRVIFGIYITAPTNTGFIWQIGQSGNAVFVRFLDSGTNQPVSSGVSITFKYMYKAT